MSLLTALTLHLGNFEVLALTSFASPCLPLRRTTIAKIRNISLVPFATKFEPTTASPA